MLIVTTLRSASAGVCPLGASQSKPARLPAPDAETTSKTTPRSAKAATAPAISAMLGAPPPSTSATRAWFSLRSALRWLFAARFTWYRCRLRGGEATCSGAVAEAALVLAMAIFLAGSGSRLMAGARPTNFASYFLPDKKADPFGVINDHCQNLHAESLSFQRECRAAI